MKIYITRHGQVDYENNNWSNGDIPLSGTGQIQAKLLGEALKKLDFSGPVFASPYKRTIATAQLIAEECKTKIYPEACLREFFFSDESARKFQGMKLCDIRRYCGYIAEDACLPYPWWKSAKDDYEKIKKRSCEFWERILKSEYEEILAVCHDASVLGTIHFLNSRFQMGFPDDFQELIDYVMNKDLNCALSCIEINKEGQPSADFFMTWFLPEEYLTVNGSHMPRPDAIKTGQEFA